MKRTLIGLLLLISSSAIAQKTITYEELKTISKGTFESIDCDIYLAKDGFSYKVGDTLKIGRPSSNKTFAYITVGSNFGTLSNNPPELLGAKSSGENTIIRKIFVSGTKKAGYKMFIIGKGACSICASNTIDFEEAIATGEIRSKGLTREQAIAKLKEAKDLVDLGMMSKEDFEKLKVELTPLVIIN
jgi:hypothetical protein